MSIVHGQAVAQETQILTTNPVTGGSTLDQIKPVKADGVELQFPSGFTCSVSGGDGPSLSFYGDSGALDGVAGSGISGLRAGMAVVIPLYRSKRAICDRPMELQNALSELEIGEKLVDSGVMSPEEFEVLAHRVKRQALGLP